MRLGPEVPPVAGQHFGQEVDLVHEAIGGPVSRPADWCDAACGDTLKPLPVRPVRGVGEGQEPGVRAALIGCGEPLATDDLALPKPVLSVAEGVNPKRPSSSGPLSVEAAPADGDSPETSVVLASVPAAEIPVEAHFSDAPPLLREMRSLGSLFTSDPLKRTLPAVRPVETPSECPAPEICIDDYLWALYERTPKIDTNKVDALASFHMRHFSMSTSAQHSRTAPSRGLYAPHRTLRAR